MNSAIDIIIVPNNGAYETLRNISMFICLYNYLTNVLYQKYTPLTIKNDIKSDPQLMQEMEQIRIMFK